MSTESKLPPTTISNNSNGNGIQISGANNSVNEAAVINGFLSLMGEQYKLIERLQEQVIKLTEQIYNLKAEKYE
jgi:hypothetical protein